MSTESRKSAIDGLPNKITILYLFETKRGTPNDTADGGGPRELPDGKGLASRESFTRRIRDYAQMVRPGSVHLVKHGPSIEEMSLRVAEGADNESVRTAAKAARTAIEAKLRGSDTETVKETEPTKLKGLSAVAFRDAMIDAYTDLGWLGGVLQTGSMRSNNVMAAICIYDATSRFPLLKYEHVGTRTMATTIMEPRERTIWNRDKVFYALYDGMAITHPQWIVENRLSDDDIKFFFEAMVKCWEHTNSGFRGENNLRGLWVVKHQSPYGSCPDYIIKEALQISCDNPEKAGSFSDYRVVFDREGLESRGLKVVDLKELYDNWGAVL